MPRIRLWHIILLALLLRLGWMFYARTEPVGDFRTYRRLAESLHDEHGYVNPFHKPTAWRLPGYPWFLYLLMFASRKLMWLRVGAVLLSTSLSIPLYYLGRRMGRNNSGPGLGAALAGALYPPFIFYSPVLASEPLEAVLFLTVLAIISDKKNIYFLKLAGGGLLMAGAALTRGFALFCLPFITLAVGFFAPGSLRKRLPKVLVFLLAASLPISAWYIRNTIVVGEGVGLSSSGGMNFWIAHNQNYHGWTACLVSHCPLYKIKTEPGICREGYRRGWQYIIDHPASLFWNMARETSVLYGLPVYGWVLSTQLHHSGPALSAIYRPLAFIPAARIISAGGYLILLALSFASLKWWRLFLPHCRNLILMVLLLHWIFHTICFFGDPRFSYINQVLLCLFAGMTLSRLISPEKNSNIPENPAPPANDHSTPLI